MSERYAGPEPHQLYGSWQSLTNDCLAGVASALRTLIKPFDGNASNSTVSDTASTSSSSQLLVQDGEETQAIRRRGSSSKRRRVNEDDETERHDGEREGSTCCSPVSHAAGLDGIVDSVFLENVAKIRKRKYAIETLKGRRDEVETKWHDAEADLFHAQQNLQGANDHEEPALRTRLQKLEIRLDKLADKMRKINAELKVHEINLNFSREENEGKIEAAVIRSQLLDEPEATSEGLSYIFDDDVRSEVSSLRSIESERPSEPQHVDDPAEQEKRDALESYEQTRAMLVEKQLEFDTRDIRYQDDLSEFFRDAEAGQCDTTRTQFDQLQVGFVRWATRDLIEAEAAYSEACNRARDLGVIGNDSVMSSDFVDDVNDGYRESKEAERVSRIDMSGITKWLCNVPETFESSTAMPETPAGDWDVRSVDFGESVSVCGTGRLKTRIERWNQIRSDRWRLTTE